MARIKESSFQAVKEAVEIVEVVSLRTSLRRVSGSHYSGRCPFHEERTPSFSVDPLNKLYHCFGCGVGGDVIKFVQETENVDFVGAIEWLAERFRITLEYEESTPREDEERRRRDRQTKLLEQATASSGTRRRARRCAHTSRSAASVRRSRGSSGSGSRGEPGSSRRRGRAGSRSRRSARRG